MESSSPHISTGPQPPYPLHSSISSRLDPIYKQFYNTHLVNQQQVHLQPISASRQSSILLPGASELVHVGKTEDLFIPRTESEGREIPIRVFTPDGEVNKGGWPVFLYFHGGGWVLGGIDTENVVCTNICKRARCVVITVDYRLAPEDPYPAAVHDAWDSFLWLHHTGHQQLNLNTADLATGGSSAGGNLAAIICQKALSHPSPLPQILTQLLIVPVTSNIALPASDLPTPPHTSPPSPVLSNPSTTLPSSNQSLGDQASVQKSKYHGPYAYPSWTFNEFVPALPAAKMLWYRRHYLPHPSTHSHPEASPLLWSGEWSKLPPALIVVGGLDVLRSEGEFYGERLREGGVDALVKCYEGMPHPFPAMDGVMWQGAETITLMVESLKTAFAS